jgi:hypothetical protein
VQGIQMRRPDPGMTESGERRVTLIVRYNQHNIRLFSCRQGTVRISRNNDAQHGNQKPEVWHHHTAMSLIIRVTSMRNILLQSMADDVLNC